MMNDPPLTAALQPPVTYSGVVHGVDCDLMGHLNTARYAAIFDSATWRMLRLLGYRWQSEDPIGWADVKNVLHYEREVPVDCRIEVTSEVSRIGGKSITLLHQLYLEGEAATAARCEAILVQFDLRERRAVSIREEYRAAARRYRSPEIGSSKGSLATPEAGAAG